MLALSHEAPVPAYGPEHLAAFEDTLRTERRLLEELTDVVIVQRLGVSRNDLTVLDDSTFSAQRILRTLAEARRRHRILLTILVGRGDLTLHEVEDALGPEMTLGLRRVLYALHDAAHHLAEELDQNRRILEGALSVGDQLLRGLTGVGAETPAVYSAPGRRPSPATTTLLDRQV